MLKKLTLYTLATTLFLSLAVHTSKSSERSEYQDYVKSIKVLQPSLSNSDANAIAKALRTVVVDGSCQFPWQILLSIAFVESSLIKSKINKKTKDYGLMQISHKNIARNGWDRSKLMRDELYNLRAACFILNYNQKHYGKRIKYWLGLYRAGVRLSDQRIINNAVAYDRIVRRTAERIGYVTYEKKKCRKR